MQEVHTTQDYVAPLQIRKTSITSAVGSNGSNASVQVHAMSAFEENYSPRPKFQNFLRASYPFQPAATPSPSTVTLALRTGDIILVHSIHTNGWADGTLLETGDRGWLPTNYCEPYDYATMRPLLKAVTEFWDIIRSGNETNAELFKNHDYMRGMVAGVRFLLEKSDCLTRESGLVKEHDSIRKIRKALLADLSNLVKAAKQMQQFALIGSNINELDDMLDDMLLTAFQTVTTAVKFFDVWSEEVVFAGPASPLPMSPISGEFVLEAEARRSQVLSRMSNGFASQQPLVFNVPENIVDTSNQRPASISSRRLTLTHRMSYSGRAPQRVTQSLASSRLNSAYDGFLGVLASFLGSHMHSRSSSELLLTTQQAVKACSRLLDVVDAISQQESANPEQLLDARETMYDRIDDLVQAAQQVFRPLQSADEDMVYLPSEGRQLITAATECVREAGRCIAKARIVLEEMGDFELDVQFDSLQSSPDEPISQQSFTNSQERPNSFNDSTDEEEMPSRPRLEISTTAAALAPMEMLSPTPATSTYWTPVTPLANDSPISFTSSPQDHLSGTTTSTTVHKRFSRPFVRDVVHSTGSQSTLVSNARDSGPSFVSDTSTRATSPHTSVKNGDSFTEKTPQIDEADEAEEEMMQHHYGHELLTNAEGKVIGGSLNALVERLTAHDSTPDQFFVSTVYLTFRLFATPQQFFDALAYRFDYIETTPRIASPVRLRVYNVIKGWLESHWRHDCDEGILPSIAEFSTNKITPAIPSAGKRLNELIEIVAKTHQPPIPRVLSAIGKTNTSTSEYIAPDQPLPQPILTKTQSTLLKTWRSSGTGISILDFDPLELARQITIKESELFCLILPEELLATEFTKQSSSLAVNVRAMAQLNTDLANLVTDSILQLEEPKRRAAVLKQWIKIGTKCLELNNYDTLMAIICAINSTTILRLKKTWDLLSQKNKTHFESLKKVVDHSKNYSQLRQRMATLSSPCLPFVGIYLTDLTFTDHGNSANRELRNGNETLTVINLDKHMKTAKIISDLQRFQVPYRLSEVPELQTWLQNEIVRVRAQGEVNYQQHYRRSLILEPRETGQSRPTPGGALASLASHKDKFDFLGWTHLSKDRTASVSS